MTSLLVSFQINQNKKVFLFIRKDRGGEFDWGYAPESAENSSLRIFTSVMVMKVLFAWSSAGTYFFIITENLDDKLG